MEKIVKKFFLFKFTLKKDKILLSKFIFLIILILVVISFAIISFNTKNKSLAKLDFALGLIVINFGGECIKDSIQSMLYILKRNNSLDYDKRYLLEKVENYIKKNKGENIK